MAASSRQFFPYDPYDDYSYYSTSPYGYAYPYYTRYPTAAAAAPRSRASTFFPAPRTRASTIFPGAGADDYAAEFPEPAVDVLRPRRSSMPRPAVSVPVQFVGSEEQKPEARAEAEMEMRAARLAAANRREREMAAVRLQAAVRGFLARRMVRMVREVRAVEAEAEALRGDARARIAVGEALMRLLLRLDAVRGAREYRRKVTKRVLALQDAVDALEHTPAPAPVVEEEVGEEGLAAVDMEAAPEVVADDATAAVEMEEEEEEEEEEEAHEAAEENGMAPESPPCAAEEHGVEAESKVEAELKSEVDVAATETAAAEMEVDGDGVTATVGEAEPDKPAVKQVVGAGDMAEQDEESEDEWEMVTAQSASAAAVDAVEPSPATEAPHKEPAAEEEKVKEKEAVASEGLDAKKVMEMVAALCERSAQNCAVIGALAERVDALERAVRRAEEADRRRRRNKKLKKEGKGNNNKCIRSCYSD